MFQLPVTFIQLRQATQSVFSAAAIPDLTTCIKKYSNTSQRIQKMIKIPHIRILNWAKREYWNQNGTQFWQMRYGNREQKSWIDASPIYIRARRTFRLSARICGVKWARSMVIILFIKHHICFAAKCLKQLKQWKYILARNWVKRVVWAAR